MTENEPIDWGVNVGGPDISQTPDTDLSGGPDSPRGSNPSGGSRNRKTRAPRATTGESRFTNQSMAKSKSSGGNRSSKRRASGRWSQERADDAMDRDYAVDRDDAVNRDKLDGVEPEPMSPERAERLARNIVLQQLTSSMKSRKQLADKLADKGVPEDIITKVLDRMEEVHLVNDESFAELWVESRHGNRKLGKRSLQRELRDKGIDEELAQKALEAVTDEDERAACHELVQKKLGVSSPEESARIEIDDSASWDVRRTQMKERDKQVRRLVSMLMRKGYNGSLAMAVVSEYV